ncbi:tyrosine-type recombinase/integrase [Microbaculum marinisediminis]|uniref:Tyrosine-type recombinase/integrase n=1 Tax=Microbaculum marinisediminis TaxID=2931392 RepID=A0AAW5QYW9_9HYPH|nr:tyrosine-type recombinase/integrase [Microbaculum sp. A6E488]MCT8973251.1 tyrosine-type recombinase/integrase [Microbaculum sp. A6E488]
MLIQVRYLQQRGKSWRYRRKVPPALRPILGKGEIVIPLGGSEAEALRRYRKAHAKAEQQLAVAVAHPPQAAPGQTELDRFRLAESQIRDWGLDLDWAGEDGPEELARDVLADSIVGKYPADAETGDPTGVSVEDVAVLRALRLGSRLTRPCPSLEDAKRLYDKERVKGDRKKRLELERIFRLVGAVVDLSRPLDRLERQDAKDVRDHMLDGGRTAASVDRYLNVVRAVINHAIAENDLACKNPFMKLEVSDGDTAIPDRLLRRPFTDAEVERIAQQLHTNAGKSLWLIWRLLAGTGCRLAEVTGLRVADVHLGHRIPHIVVEGHKDRRLKTKSSNRVVPLKGDAHAAAKEAVKAAGSEALLFKAYCRLGGPDAASAAIGKHVDAVIGKVSKVGPTHSLRHRMADKLGLAGAPDGLRDRFLGHTKGASSESYGGSLEAWLEMSSAILAKALSCRIL